MLQHLNSYVTVKLPVLYSVYIPRRRTGDRWVYHQCKGVTITQLGNSMHVEPGEDATALLRGRLERKGSA